MILESIPQELKLSSFLLAQCGTTKVVPFQNGEELEIIE
jgi:hypothetical protein